MNESLDALREAEKRAREAIHEREAEWEDIQNDENFPPRTDHERRRDIGAAENRFSLAISDYRDAVEARVRAEVAAEGRTAWSRAGVSREPRHPAEVFHAGVTLNEEIEARGTTPERLADALGMPWTVVREVSQGLAAMDVTLALALEEQWGVSAQFWMNLQTSWEIGMEVALREEWARIHGTEVTR